MCRMLTVHIDDHEGGWTMECCQICDRACHCFSHLRIKELRGSLGLEHQRIVQCCAVVFCPSMKASDKAAVTLARNVKDGPALDAMATFNGALYLDSPSLRVYLPGKGLRCIYAPTANLGAVFPQRQLCNGGNVRSLCILIAIQKQCCAICVQNLAKSVQKQAIHCVNTLQNNMLAMFGLVDIPPAEVFLSV